MLKIAICEDSEIFVEIIKKNIETILKVPYELRPFLSGKEFITSLPEIGCPYDIVFWIFLWERKRFPELNLAR